MIVEYDQDESTPSLRHQHQSAQPPDGGSIVAPLIATLQARVPSVRRGDGAEHKAAYYQCGCQQGKAAPDGLGQRGRGHRERVAEGSISRTSAPLLVKPPCLGVRGLPVPVSPPW